MTLLIVPLFTASITIGSLQQAFGGQELPEISIEKTCEVQEPNEPGFILWDMRITNTGKTTVDIEVFDPTLADLLGIPNPRIGILSDFEPGDMIGLTFGLPNLPAATYSNVVTITATDAEGNVATDEASAECEIFSSTIDIDIDIKPGSDPNSVNTNSKGVLPVAILGGPDLDVEEIDISSVAGVTTSVDFAIDDLWVALPLRCSVGDVNDDGILDLNCKFSKNELMLDCWTSGLTVSGNLLDGTPFIGSDTIRPVPCDEEF